MDIYASIQYWFLMIFLQFAPLNDLETGNTFIYTLSEPANARLKFEVIRKFEKYNKTHMGIKVQFVGNNPSKTFHTVVMRNKNNVWYINSLRDNRHEMINPDEQTMSIDRTADPLSEIIISTDLSYILRRPVNDKNTTMQNNSFTFRKNDMFITVDINKMRQLTRAKIIDNTVGINAEMKLE